MRMTKKYLKKDIYLLKKKDNIFDKIDINIIYNSIIMEHQNIINLLDNTPSQPTKFRTKKWIEINDDSCRTYNTNSQIRFKTSILKTSLCDYSYVYILVSGKHRKRQQSQTIENIIIKNCASFTNCISEIKNTQTDKSKETDAIMLMYNLLEYRDYSERSGNYRYRYRYEPFLDAIVDFRADNDNSASFKFKTKKVSKTGNDGNH